MNKQLIGKILMVITIALGLVAFIVLAVLDPLPVSSSKKQFNQHKSFMLDDFVKNIFFSLIITDLKIKSIDGDELKLYLYASKVNTELTILVEKIGDTINISIDGEDILENISEEIRLMVELPSKFDESMSVNLISGDFEMENTELRSLNIDVTSSSCSLSDSQIESLHINTISGNSTLSGIITSDANVSSTSGDLDFSSFEGNIDAVTTSGDIKIMFDKNPDKINLFSTSGDIDLQLDDAGFIIDANTASGDISCEKEMTIQKFDEHEVQGYYGDKSCRVNVKTTSGDIEISL